MQHREVVRSIGKHSEQGMRWGNPNFLPGEELSQNNLIFYPASFILDLPLAAQVKTSGRVWGCHFYFFFFPNEGVKYMTYCKELRERELRQTAPSLPIYLPAHGVQQKQ